MEISNIKKTGGTIATPILSANIDNIEFTNIPTGGKGTKGSTFWNHSANVDVWKADGDGTKWKPSVNAVDIAWNGAKPGIGEPADGINTTGELLATIKTLKTRIDQLEAAFSTLATNVGTLVTITNG
jgi:hypothetical protein